MIGRALTIVGGGGGTEQERPTPYPRPAPGRPDCEIHGRASVRPASTFWGPHARSDTISDRACGGKGGGVASSLRGTPARWLTSGSTSMAHGQQVARHRFHAAGDASQYLAPLARVVASGWPSLRGGGHPKHGPPSRERCGGGCPTARGHDRPSHVDTARAHEIGANLRWGLVSEMPGIRVAEWPRPDTPARMPVRGSWAGTGPVPPDHTTSCRPRKAPAARTRAASVSPTSCATSRVARTTVPVASAPARIGAMTKEANASLS